MARLPNISKYCKEAAGLPEPKTVDRIDLVERQVAADRDCAGCRMVHPAGPSPCVVDRVSSRRRYYQLTRVAMANDGDPLSEELLRSFGTVYKGLRQCVRSHVAAQPGITVGRAGLLLGLLEQDEPVGMGALGAAHDLTPRSMTVLVHGLEREGLVRRTRHADDRRVTLVSLTPAGRAIPSQQLIPAWQQAAAPVRRAV